MQNIDIIIYIFIFIILISFACLVFCKSGKNKEDRYEKIIGGLSVFLVALIANITWLYVISFFIGGLIIASENFMMFLAAIIKTDSKNIPKTVAAFAKKAKEYEINKKLITENKIKIPEVPSEPEESAIEYINNKLKKVKIIEKKISDYMEEKYGKNYHSYVKYSNTDRMVIFDGIINYDDGTETVVEIKFLTRKDFPILKKVITHVNREISSFDICANLLLVIVSEKLTKDDIKSILKENQNEANFIFFKYRNNKIINIKI